MINLLPDYEIRNNLREYRRRRLVVAEFFGLAVLLAAILLNVSLFFVLRFKQTAVKQSLTAVKVVLVKDDEQAAASLGLVQKQLRRLGKTLDVEPRLTSALKAVLEHQAPGIRLVSINYERPEGKPVILRLSGLAATRPALLKFVNSLGTDAFFSVIESPATNLIKDQNVDFSLSLTVKTKD